MKKLILLSLIFFACKSEQELKRAALFTECPNPYFDTIIVIYKGNFKLIPTDTFTKCKSIQVINY
jgi:hypothetical protein